MEAKIVTAQDLAGVVSIIDVCSQRGAFRGEELAGVGRLRETFLAEIREQQGDAEAPAAVEAPVVNEEPAVDYRKLNHSIDTKILETKQKDIYFTIKDRPYDLNIYDMISLKFNPFAKPVPIDFTKASLAANLFAK